MAPTKMERAVSTTPISTTIPQLRELLPSITSTSDILLFDNVQNSGNEHGHGHEQSGTTAGADMERQSIANRIALLRC